VKNPVYEVGSPVQVKLSRAGFWRDAVVAAELLNGELAFRFTDLEGHNFPAGTVLRGATLKPTAGTVRHTPKS
jgi:hypothetical protein